MHIKFVRERLPFMGSMMDGLMGVFFIFIFFDACECGLTTNCWRVLHSFHVATLCLPRAVVQKVFC